MNEAMKGHTFAEVSKKKASKIFTDVETLERVTNALNNDGKVFAVHEKEDLVCYYIFERVQIMNTYAYKLIEEYWKPEKEHLREVFEKTVRENLKEYISWGMAEEVHWKEDVYVLEKGKKKAFSIAGIAVGIMFGFSFGTSMDNMVLGISMSMMWAMIFNMLFTASDRKLVKKERHDAITQ